VCSAEKKVTAGGKIRPKAENRPKAEKKHEPRWGGRELVIGKWGDRDVPVGIRPSDGKGLSRGP